MDDLFEETVLVDKETNIEFINNRYFRITHLGLEKKRVNLIDELEELKVDE